MTTGLNRRDFLRASAAAGGGLALQFSFPVPAAAASGAPATEVNAWVVIHADDRVVVRIARSEMGQGTYTALAQLVAEELDCDWSRVSAEFASPNEHIKRNRIWGSMSTGGSLGVRGSQDYVRRAGAAARQMLVAAAAARWGVPAGECTAREGVITHPPTKRILRYGQVAAAAAALEPPRAITLRDPKDWRIAGKPLRRLDLPDKVTGKPVFAVDVALPGLLHASIAQCPVFGGSVRGVDSAEAEKMRGVKKVVREPGFVAVVADSWWRANEALKKVKIDWDPGPGATASTETVAAMLRDGL
ncbi:MAG TPA: aldehyde dehydrogenase, partial [Candidatus Rokubacteria bacterium]|nr:aldehyde dehydrogenase [Candidatus Rokubacteria bacterium]